MCVCVCVCVLITGFSSGCFKVNVFEAAIFAAADDAEHCSLIGAFLQDLTGTDPLYAVRCLCV